MRGSAAKEEVPPRMELMPGRVKAARVGRKMKQTELADLAGVSQTTVSNMETRASLEGVRLVSAVRIAESLKMSLDELVLGVPNLYVQLAQAMAEGRVSPTDLAPKEPGPVAEPARASEPAPMPPKRRQRRPR